MATKTRGEWAWTDADGVGHEVVLDGDRLVWSREDRAAHTFQTRQDFALRGPAVSCPDRITKSIKKAIGTTGMSWRAS